MLNDSRDPVISPDTRTSIADATIRVIARAGFDAVSIRSVARAAGVAPGTVQHHVHSRDQLLLAALERMIERQLSRLMPPSAEAHPTERLRVGLGALLPIDAQRREEGIVWVAFSAAASTRPTLRKAHGEALELARGLIRRVLKQATATGQLQTGQTVEIGTYVLTAMIDGLILDGINAPESDGPLLVAALHHAIDLVVIPPLPSDAPHVPTPPSAKHRHGPSKCCPR